jgi:hypothetical protein
MRPLEVVRNLPMVVVVGGDDDGDGNGTCMI